MNTSPARVPGTLRVVAWSARYLLDAGRELFAGVLPPLGWRDGVPPSGRQISLPTALIRRPGDRGLRMDHLLVSPDVRVLDACVLHATPGGG